MTNARYDGIASWYDDMLHGKLARDTAEVNRLVQELLGKGSGSCLDLGCGGEIILPLLSALGWSPVGLDISLDQLRVARERIAALRLVKSDAIKLPFRDGSFDSVIARLVSSDIEPWEDLVREAARVLRPGGVLVNVSVHPCFVGPHAAFLEDGGRRILPDSYRRRDRIFQSETFSSSGLRSKVGVAQVPPDDLLNAFLGSRLTFERIIESRNCDGESAGQQRKTMATSDVPVYLCRTPGGCHQVDGSTPRKHHAQRARARSQPRLGEQWRRGDAREGGPQCRPRRLSGEHRSRIRYKTFATPFFTSSRMSPDELRLLARETGWTIGDVLDRGEGIYIAVLEKGGE